MKWLIRRKWAVGAALAIVLAVAAVLYSRYADTRLPPSGDPLFDKYAAWVWRDYRSDPKQRKRGMPKDYVPLAEVKKWEPQFGNDPRYWELRYWCAKQEAMLDSIAASKLNANATSQQMRAWSTAISKSELTAGLAELHAARVAGKLGSRGLLLLCLDDKSLTVDQELAALNEAVAKDPKYDWAQYYRGMFLLEHGKLKSAEQDLTSAGKLPPGPYPCRPFPADVFTNYLLTGKPTAAGRVFAVTYGDDSNSFAWGFAVRDALGKTGASVDSSMLTALNNMGYRLALSDSGQFLCESAGGMIIQGAHYCAERTPDPAHVDFETAIEGILNRLAKARGDLLQANAKQSGLKLYGLVTKPLESIGLGSLVERQQVREFYQNQVAEARRTAATFAPYLEALKDIDYAHPVITHKMQALLASVPDPYPQETAKYEQGLVNQREAAIASKLPPPTAEEKAALAKWKGYNPANYPYAIRLAPQVSRGVARGAATLAQRVKQR